MLLQHHSRSSFFFKKNSVTVCSVLIRKHTNIWYEAFTATKYNEFFSGYQPLRTKKMVLETCVLFKFQPPDTARSPGRIHYSVSSFFLLFALHPYTMFFVQSHTWKSSTEFRWWCWPIHQSGSELFVQLPHHVSAKTCECPNALRVQPYLWFMSVQIISNLYRYLRNRWEQDPCLCDISNFEWS